MVRTAGWPDPFREIPWEEIAPWFRELAGMYEDFRHMADIVGTVIACGATKQLAACTSMHDLIVVRRPLPEPPFDVIRVYSPSSLRPVGAGQVVIEHQTVTGRNDRISRPSAEAVPLFWRFLIEKYGVTPDQTSSEEVPPGDH
jgi:hypothetical protein